MSLWLSLCERGGTGIRARLRTLCPKGRGGSTPLARNFERFSEKLFTGEVEAGLIAALPYPMLFRK